MPSNPEGKNNRAGRPSFELTISVIPQGPMPTNRKKWASIARYHAINDDRKKAGWEEISVKEFCKWTQIAEEDVFNAESHKEYVDVAMSLAKGKSVMWFRSQLADMQEAAENLKKAGEDKEYLKVALELSNMVKFKDFDLSGMEEAETKGVKETVEEVMALLADDQVRRAINNEDGQVAQKIIPSLVGASFKPGTKSKILTSAQLDNPLKTDSVSRPDQPLDSVSETGDRPLQ